MAKKPVARVTYNKWVDPRTEAGMKNLRQEYHVEYTLKHLSDMLDDAWPSFDDFLRSVQKAKIVEITPSMDNRIDYRSQTRSKPELLSLLKSYRSWNQKDPKTGQAYRSMDTVNNLYDRFTQNEPLFMPIVLQLPDSGMRVFGGNTRMDIAFQLGINPKVLLVPVPTKAVEEALGHDNEWGTHELVQKYKSATPGENSKYTAEGRTMTDSILSTVMRATKPYTQKYVVEAPATKKAAPILKDWTIDELQKHVMSYVGKHDDQNKLKLTYPAAYTHGIHRGEDNQPLVQMVVDEVNQMAGEQQRHAFAAGFASTRPESVEESTMYGNPNRAPQTNTPATGKRDAQTHLSCPKCGAEWYSDRSRGNSCPKCKNTSGIVATGSETVYGESVKKKVTEGLCSCCTPAQLHEAAEYQGRKVTLNKPFRTPGGPKKFSVYVKNEKGNVVKVNFGDPAMEIKRDDPERRKNFRARHNCDNPGPKWKARYWSCQWGWGAKKLST